MQAHEVKSQASSHNGLSTTDTRIPESGLVAAGGPVQQSVDARAAGIEYPARAISDPGTLVSAADVL